MTLNWAAHRLDTANLYRYHRRAQELGWDTGIHCCGDRSQDTAVEALARVAEELPRPDARHNIIHAYFPTDRALELMARHCIAAVIQPTFLYWEGDMICATWVSAARSTTSPRAGISTAGWC